MKLHRIPASLVLALAVSAPIFSQLSGNYSINALAPSSPSPPVYSGGIAPGRKP